MNFLWLKDILQRQKNKFQGYSMEMDPISADMGSIEKTAKVQYTATHTSDDASLNVTRISAKKGWTPIWLRRSLLAGFLVLFVAIFVALQVLYSVSQRNHGLATSNDNYHYLWTYGPTAILTILVAFWRQVDYHCKQIMPWAELANGPTTADKSLLLDYISPIQLVALTRAVKNRHGLIILTSVSFLLLNLLIVFSTGLFILIDSTMDGSFAFQTTNKFDGSAFNPFLVDSRSTYTTYGALAQELPLPNGTTQQNGTEYVYQQFQPLKSIAGAEVTGRVDVFYTDMDCETGNYTWLAYNSSDYNAARENYYINVSYPSGCRIVNAPFDAPAWMYYDLPGNTFEGSYGRIQAVNCTNEKGIEANRILVMLGYSRGHSFVNKLLKLSNILCKPKYGIFQSDVTFNTSSIVNDVIIRNSSSSNNLLSNVSYWDFGMGVMHSLALAQNIADVVGVGDADLETTTNSSLDTFSYLMTISEPNLTLADLYNASTLERATKSVFNKIGTQMANRYLTSTQNATSQFIGRTVYTKERLVVRELSLRAMQAILIILVIFVALICFLAPQGVVSRSPDSIGSLATIFASSGVLSIFNGTGHLRLADIRRHLAGRKFRTAINSSGTFFIQETGSESLTAGQPIISEVVQTKIKWWRPIAVINISIVATLLVPLGLIAALEAIYHQSKEHDGLTDLDNSGYVHYAYVYIPALVMVCLSTLFLTLDAAIRTIQPYHALRLGSRAYKSVLDHPLGKMTLPAAWNALRKWQPALLATSFGALFAPLLTILVSGLFTSRYLAFSSPAELQQTSLLNLTWTYDSDHPTIPPLQNILASLAVEGNLSFPQWTYEEYVFANYQFANASTKIQNQYFNDDTILNITLPALRGVLNCSSVKKELITSAFVYEDDTGLSNGTSLFLNVSTPDGCGNFFNPDAPDGADGAPLSTSYGYNLSQVPNTGYFGSYSSVGDIGLNCPTVGFFFGHVSRKKLDDLPILFCTPYVEQLNVSLHLTIPDLAIDVTQPPEPVQNSVGFYANDTADLVGNFVLASEPIFQTLNITSDTNQFSDVFQAVIYGKDGVPIEELRNTTRLVNALQHVVGILAAQTISVQARLPAANVSDTSDLLSLNGTITGLQRVRLEQSLLSTRILEVVLAIMFLCAALAYLLVDTKRILADSPGSIAAVASLLAGSQMTTRAIVPEGSEWWSDDESEKKKLFGGHIYSLGWWGQGEGRRYGIDVGKAESTLER